MAGGTRFLFLSLWRPSRLHFYWHGKVSEIFSLFLCGTIKFHFYLYGDHVILYSFIWGSMRFHFCLYGDFTRVSLYLYGEPQDFIFIYMGDHMISSLSIWGSMRFHFYLYGVRRDFIFIYIGDSKDKLWNRKKSQKFENYCFRFMGYWNWCISYKVKQNYTLSHLWGWNI